ncbi:MAG: HAMP domain-containing sensor histidine kinase [Patescibacteria group bacterium]
MFRDKLQIPRERLEFFYSIFILVTIPVLLVANTLVMSVAVRRDLDSELRRKADLASSVIAAASQSKLDKPAELQDELVHIKQGSDEILSVTIAEPSGQGGFTVIAADDTKLIGQESGNIQYSAATSKKQSIAQLITDSQGKRLWSVVRPVVVNNEVKAVVTTSVSLQRADSLIGSTLLRSLIILGVTVVVIVLMLLNHFRFVEYAILFRKLKEVDQLKNDFLSVASHELKAPMTVIRGDIENLIDGLTGNVDEKGKQALMGVSAETDRLNNLVNDLLNVSRIEQNRITYNLEKIDARQIIDNIVKNFTANATAKGLELVYERPGAPTIVNVDRGRLIEIMTNLVDNAIKYSRQGKVTVSHKPEPGKVIISVRDTGIGMSAKERERLFSRFYRIRNEKTQDVPGTGLGLWIIHQYVTHMDGSITVDSLENVGSEFNVEFPLVSPDL